LIYLALLEAKYLEQKIGPKIPELLRGGISVEKDVQNQQSHEVGIFRE